MIFGMTYFQICLYFLVYSFGGWVVEVIFHAVALGKVINRGFLNGPVCPVYGFGVLSVFAMLNTIQSGGHQMNDAMIFLFGIILATAVELIAGWLLDVCFHARWWDYSDKPFNFHGYICLEFSLIWGLAIVMVVKVIQKYVESNGYSVVRDLVGHGIGTHLHEDPQIPNFKQRRKGMKFRPGMTLAIEPMVNEGSYDVVWLDDDWTVVTEDGSLAAHYENTIVITEDGCEILTLSE